MPSIKLESLEGSDCDVEIHCLDDNPDEKDREVAREIKESLKGRSIDELARAGCLMTLTVIARRAGINNDHWSDIVTCVFDILSYCSRVETLERVVKANKENKETLEKSDDPLEAMNNGLEGVRGHYVKKLFARCQNLSMMTAVLLKESDDGADK